MNARYQVSDDVEHGCCNEARVIDTTRPEHAQTVCECPEIDEADYIAALLNAADFDA